MSIISVVAKFECDNCGAYFSVNMDESSIPPKDWSIMACAEDSVRGGGESLSDFTSINDIGEHLCSACTGKTDPATHGSAS